MTIIDRLRCILGVHEFVIVDEQSIVTREFTPSDKPYHRHQQWIDYECVNCGAEYRRWKQNEVCKFDPTMSAPDGQGRESPGWEAS